MRSFLAAAAFGSAFAVLPAFAVQAPDDVAECHRLTADTVDPGRLAEPVRFAELNPEIAIPVCERALKARPDDGRLRHGLARLFGKAKRGEDAKAAFLAAAEAGFAPAWTGLGDTLRFGDGVPVDFVAAARAYEKAANAGNMAGTASLGYAYQVGEGVEKDEAKAVELYRTAAAGGSSFGQHKLGWMLMEGVGVPRDDTEAVRLFRLAAAQGSAEALNDLGSMTLQGRGGLAADWPEAVRLFRQAFELNSDPGSSFAAVNLATAYSEGRGVPADSEAAERMLRYALANTTDTLALPRAQNAMAWRLALAGKNLDEAETLARAAIAAAEENGEDLATRLDTLGWVLHRGNRNAEALPLLLRATEINTQDPVIFDHLGDVLAALGREAEARTAWEKAAALPPHTGFFASPIDLDAVRRKLAG